LLIQPRRIVPEPVYSSLHTPFKYLFFVKNIRDVIDCDWQVHKDIMAERRKTAKDKKQSETERMQQKRDLAAADKMQQGIVAGGSFAAAAEQPALNLKKR
jgi:hypothetical protein